MLLLNKAAYKKNQVKNNKNVSFFKYIVVKTLGMGKNDFIVDGLFGYFKKSMISME